jgi:hypothetical protein
VILLTIGISGLDYKNINYFNYFKFVMLGLVNFVFLIIQWALLKEITANSIVIRFYKAQITLSYQTLIKANLFTSIIWLMGLVMVEPKVLTFMRR